MVLPAVQRGGYGKFLIDFSYTLSQIEGKTGAPEKPLSDLGHKAYVSYWTHIVLNILLENKSPRLSIQDIATRTGITCIDIQYVLKSYGILKEINNKTDCLYTEPEFLKGILAKLGYPPRRVYRENVHWVPWPLPKAT